MMTALATKGRSCVYSVEDLGMGAGEMVACG